MAPQGKTPSQLALKEWPVPEISPQEAMLRVGGPTLINLNQKQVSAHEVFAMLSQQTGLSLVIPNNGQDIANQKWPLITLEAENEPFWKVMQRLDQQLSFRLQKNAFRSRNDPSIIEVLIYEKERGVQPWMSGFSQQTDPLWIVATQAVANVDRTYTLGSPRVTKQSASQFAFFSLYPDPHLMPALIPGTVQYWFDEATNQNGRPVNTKLKEPQEASALNTVQWNLILHCEAKSASTSLRRVKGKFTTLLALERSLWEIPISLSSDEKASARAERTFKTAQGELNYHVELVQIGDEYELEISWAASMTRKPPPYSLWQLLANQNMRVVDKNGQALSTFGSDGSKAKALYKFQCSNPFNHTEAGPPAKIVFNIATDVRRLTVPFEFHDLPLPTP